MQIKHTHCQQKCHCQLPFGALGFFFFLFSPECLKLFCGSSSAWAFAMPRGFPLQRCSPYPVPLLAAFPCLTWACWSCRPSALLLLAFVPMFLSCVCTSWSAVMSLLPAFSGKAIATRMRMSFSFCFLFFPESNFNRWSLLHAIGYRPCKEIFKPVSTFF